MIIQLLSYSSTHPVIQSLSHPGTQSPSHSVTLLGGLLISTWPSDRVEESISKTYIRVTQSKNWEEADGKDRLDDRRQAEVVTEKFCLTGSRVKHVRRHILPYNESVAPSGWPGWFSWLNPKSAIYRSRVRASLLASFVARTFNKPLTSGC